MPYPPAPFAHHLGHAWTPAPGRTSQHDTVRRSYVEEVLVGGQSDDAFWEGVRARHPILPLTPIRQGIANGDIVRMPEKTPASEIVDEGWYWISLDGTWEVAQAKGAETWLVFWRVMTDEDTSYDRVAAIGDRIEEPDALHDDGHAHDDGGTCPLCPSPETLQAMGDRNRAAAAAKRVALLAEIESDPASFVHVVEGYEDENDRSPAIMLVARTLDEARAFCTDTRSSGLFEVTPHRVGDRRTGEVVLYHYIENDGTRVEGEGRFLRSSS